MRRKVLIVLVSAAASLAAIAAALAASGSDTFSAFAKVLGREDAFEPSAATIVDGKRWVVGHNTTADQDCIEIRSAQGWRAASCPPAERPSAPILAYTGGTDTSRFLYGRVTERVDVLKLVRADCRSQVLQLSKDGVFLVVDTPSASPPYKLIARGDGGEPISSHVLRGKGAGTPASDVC